MAQFVQNFFACCGGTPELNKTFRTSDASNMLQYSFIAEPEPISPKENRYRSFAGNPLEEANADFKSSRRSSIMEEDPDPDQDLREEADFADFAREDESEILSVQRPIDTMVSNRFRAPGSRIDDCNQRASVRDSEARITVGTIQIATRE